MAQTRRLHRTPRLPRRFRPRLLPVRPSESLRHLHLILFLLPCSVGLFKPASSPCPPCSSSVPSVLKITLPSAPNTPLRCIFASLLLCFVASQKKAGASAGQGRL